MVEMIRRYNPLFYVGEAACYRGVIRMLTGISYRGIYSQKLEMIAIPCIKGYLATLDQENWNTLGYFFKRKEPMEDRLDYTFPAKIQQLKFLIEKEKEAYLNPYGLDFLIRALPSFMIRECFWVNDLLITVQKEECLADARESLVSAIKAYKDELAHYSKTDPLWSLSKDNGFQVFCETRHKFLDDVISALEPITGITFSVDPDHQEYLLGKHTSEEFCKIKTEFSEVLIAATKDIISSAEDRTHQAIYDAMNPW